MSFVKMSLENKDALREVFSIGVGHASSALSDMTGERVDFGFPSVKEYKVEDVVSLFGSSDAFVVTVFLNMDGIFEEGMGASSLGKFILIFEKGDAINFSNLIQKKDESELDSLALDALKETGNILSGSCLNAVSEFLNFRLIESLPGIGVDMLGATLDSFLAEFSGEVDYVLLFRTSFRINSRGIESYLLLLFDPSASVHMIKKIAEVENG